MLCNISPIRKNLKIYDRFNGSIFWPSDDLICGYRASFVGFVYGYATIATSSLVVPMISHAMNNLVGGILWQYSSDSSGEISDSN